MHAWDAADPKAPPGAPGDARLRDAEPTDHAALLRLWRELMDLHSTLDPRFELAKQADQRFYSYIETAMAREDYRVRIAEIHRAPIGFSVACVLPNSPVYRTRWVGYINDLCVTATSRGAGAGRMLVRDAAAWLRRCGAESVEVYVADHNSRARGFWQKMGGQPYLHRLSLDLTQLLDD